MSDSDDDNTYSNYLESRRAACLKKRQPVQTCDSDSDDDDFPAKRAAVTRKVSKGQEAGAGGYSDDDSILDCDQKHDEVVSKRLDNFEDEYRRKIFDSKDSVIHVHNEKNDALMKTLRKVDACCDPELEEELTKKEKKPDLSILEEESTLVTFIIMDCESRLTDSGTRNRRDVDLNSTFFEIRKELAEKWKCRVNEVSLTYEGRKVVESDTPKTLGFVATQLPLPHIQAAKEQFVEIADGPSSPKVVIIETISDAITIKVQLKNRKKPVHIQLLGENTVEDIMQKVIEALTAAGEPADKIPPIGDMKAMFDDEYCDNSQTCKDLGLEDADCIDIYY